MNLWFILQTAPTDGRPTENACKCSLESGVAVNGNWCTGEAGYFRAFPSPHLFFCQYPFPHLGLSITDKSGVTSRLRLSNTCLQAVAHPPLLSREVKEWGGGGGRESIFFLTSHRELHLWPGLEKGVWSRFDHFGDIGTVLEVHRMWFNLIKRRFNLIFESSSYLKS